MASSRSSLVASVAMHVAVIGFGLISLSSPRPMEMPSTDAIPVDIVPLEEEGVRLDGGIVFLPGDFNARQVHLRLWLQLTTAAGSRSSASSRSPSRARSTCRTIS